MLALGGKREGKRKGLASRLPECCVFPRKSKYLWLKGFWRFCADKEKSLPLTLGFIQTKSRFSFVLSVVGVVCTILQAFWLSTPSIQFYNFSNKDFFLPFGQAYEKER